MAMRFGEEVRRARQRSEISLKTVAEALQFSVPYLSDIERGFRNPPAPAKIRIWAEIIALDPDRLIEIAEKDRPTIELPIAGQSDAKAEIAYSLARAWEDLTPEDEERLLRELNDITGRR